MLFDLCSTQNMAPGFVAPVPTCLARLWFSEYGFPASWISFASLLQQYAPERIVSHSAAVTAKNPACSVPHLYILWRVFDLNRLAASYIVS